MIGTNVRTKREAKGMTQVALAEAVEAIQSTISAIENGTRQPSVSMLVRLAAALGCSADELLQSPNGFCSKDRFTGQRKKKTTI